VAHYIQYWAPLRSGIAFDQQDAPVLELENGWFKTLKPNDVVWIVTREKSKTFLVLRFVVRRIAPSRNHPDYAVGNSPWFKSVRAVTAPDVACLPRKVPITVKFLRRLRFDTRTASNRIVKSGMQIFELELAAMRRLKNDTHVLLEESWDANSGPLWIATGD
jgi:hypothetical protein